MNELHHPRGRSRVRERVTPLLLTVALSTVTAGCAREPEVAPAAPAPLRVRVVAVRRGDIADVLTATGETAALTTLRLASPVAGRIVELTTRPGDRLAKDEIAVRVISLENEAALHGFTVLEETRHLGADERRLAQRLQQEIRGRAVPLRVPFAAVVAERLHSPGELVAQNDVLLELFDPDSLYALAQVPVEFAARVHVGLPAEVDLSGMTVPAEVAALVTAVAPQSLTVPVRIKLATAPQPPLVHAAVRCRITLARNPDALVIPRSALLSSRVTETGIVMVAEHQQAERREVRLGLRTLHLVEIRDGLREGDLVVAQGQYGLPDGTPIEPLQSTAE